MRFLMPLFFLLFFVGSPSFGEQQIPEGLQDVGIVEKIETRITPGYTFVDSNGNTFSMDSLFSDGSTDVVLLNFVYFNCPMLCSLFLDGFVASLNELRMPFGDRFKIVTISMDTADTVAHAKAFKDRYLKKLNQDIDPDDWHFLISPDDQVKQLADSVGFQYKVLANGEISHTAAVIVLTPDADISRYLYGVATPAFDIKLAILEGLDRKFVSTIEQGLLYCYRYDSSANSYVIHAWTLMRAGAAITVLLLLIFMLKSRFKD